MTLFNASSSFSRAQVRAELPKNQHRSTDSSPDYVRMRMERDEAMKENSRLNRQLNETRDELEGLRQQKTEHQLENPGGCVDARSVPQQPEMCPGCGHVTCITCYSEVPGDQVVREAIVPLEGGKRPKKWDSE